MTDGQTDRWTDKPIFIGPPPTLSGKALTNPDQRLSIFRDKSVQSSIPNYFKNCEVPIICYKYNKPIRGAIFNFNKLVSDLNIETCTPDS